jgi:hypothetical protein
MKMHRQDYIALCNALAPFLAQGSPVTMRDRWELLWRSGFDVETLYKAGLNDDHIDTALRRMSKQSLERD